MPYLVQMPPSAKKAKVSLKNKVKAKEKRKSNIQLEFNPDPSPQLTNFLRPEKRFNILPFNAFHTIISMSADILPLNYSKRHYFIKKHFPIGSPIAGQNMLLSLPIDSINTGWSKEKSIEIRRANNFIMRCRTAFRKLLHHMRVRRLQKANTEDVLTGEIPKHPVYIVDWKENKIYTFEAYTLMKDITERLLHHDGLFEYPQAPRNPFTNIPLTQAQTISVWNSLSRAGIPVSSAFTLFRNVSYSLRKFWDENMGFLRLNSLRKTMKEANSYDYNERMADFINYCYTVESIDCPLACFKIAVKRYPNHHLIRKWAALCQKYYEADIIHSGNAEKIKYMKDEVLDDTYELLHLDKQIITLNTVIESIPQTNYLNAVIETLDFLLEPSAN
jgi:hypothetical protein